MLVSHHINGNWVASVAALAHVCVCVCMRYMNIKLYFYLFPFLLPTVCRPALLCTAHAARPVTRRSRRHPPPPSCFLPATATASRRATPLRAHKAKFIRKHFILFPFFRSYSHFLSFSFALSPFATRRTPKLVLTVTPT